jgi:hypothetical protein
MRATRWLQLIASVLVLASLAFGQVGNSSVTGIVLDQAGAVVAGATVEAKNAETGVIYRGVTTNTGNYTIPGVPVGTYTVSVALKGFKTYSHPNLALASSSVLKEDVNLTVGSQTESVTVTEQASLLKTETSELASNVTLKDLDDLPMLGIGTANAGSTGVRNPFNVLELLPGVTGFTAGAGFTFSVNGLGVETMRIEGQDATSRIFGTATYQQMAQPSADSIQEMSFQTSNYAAEYGQASSVVINMTMKSGTNQYHGSGYDYFVNEDLDAGVAFSISGGPSGGDGSKLRPRQRRNDFGGTLGGPVFIPKVYNGHDRTFFFWNYEQFLETIQYTFQNTVPTPAYLGGDFGAISPNGTCSLCSTYGITTGDLGCTQNVTGCSGAQLDPLQRTLKANTIYNPTTRTTAPNGLGVATPFLNNMIPSTMFDPVGQKLLNLVSSLGVHSENSNLIQNRGSRIAGNRYSAIPSLKVDHSIDARDKLSFYYSEINTESQISQQFGNADGLPLEIGGYRGTFIPSYTYRLNYDRTVRPNLLLHMGVGYFYTRFLDHAPFLSFDPSTLGLTNFLIHRQFPSFVGLSSGTYGGLQNIGTANQGQTLNYDEKPSYSVNATWIRGKHTFKLGADLFTEGVIGGTFAGVTFVTGTGPTSQPFTTTANLNGFGTGFGFASFLLGDYTSSAQTAQLNSREGYQEWGLYLQDTWKLTRKLTLDYGLRWDLYTPEHETYGRLGQIAPSVANAAAGGHPGATQFASTCNCQFYHSGYPYAIGPRIGVAYQINPKTVFRGGWGLVYQNLEAAAGNLVSSNGAFPLIGVNPTFVPSAFQYVNTQQPGFIVAPVYPDNDPFRYPTANATPGAGAGAPAVTDANQNRPPRVNQWSVGIQREVTRNFVVEAAYVANRTAWLGGFLGELSQINPSTYAALGIYPYPGTGPGGNDNGYKPAGVNCVAGNDCDRALLSQPLSSAAVKAKLAAAGFPNGYLPYAGYPTSNSLASVLVPFPQFGAINPSGSATGDSKYDSLQVKGTKRLSHGLSAGGTFTWAQGFTRAIRQDFFNPQSSVSSLMTSVPPRTLQFNFTYTVPKIEMLDKVKFANTIVKDWQVGGFADYQSAPFLGVPSSPTANFLGSQDRYVDGQPLYNKDINNIGSINPYTDIVLNPKAWTPCTSNTTCGTNNVLKGFRGFRHPQENANFGRNFRIKERMNLYIRAEFVNIFNRTLLPQPSTLLPANNPTKNGAGVYTSGFGTVNAYQSPGTASIFSSGGTAGPGPRTGTLIARFTF